MHRNPSDQPPSTQRLPTFAKAVVVLLVLSALATVGGLIALWPSGDRPALPEHLEITMGAGSDLVAGSVVSVDLGPCGSPSANKPFVDKPAQPIRQVSQCPQTIIDIESGPDAGQRTMLETTPGPGQPVLAVGDQVRLSRSTGFDGETAYGFEDFTRSVPLALWGLAAAIVVCAVGAWRGFRALLGVGVAMAVIVGFLLPSLLDGNSPVALAVVAGAAILFVVLYLAHGVSLRTSAALFGTLSALLLAAGLSKFAIATTSITGLAEDNSATIQAFLGEVSVTGLLLAGFIIGSLGVLNDVTISQAATVFELAGVDQTLTVRQLFGTAMRVGRDHIASMVYTLVLAYAGASLPLLIIFSVSQRSLSEILTSDIVAVELVRSIVGAIAVVLAVPLTTLVAALLTRGTDSAILAAGPSHQH